MSKSRVARHSYKPLFVIFGASLLIGLGFGFYRYLASTVATAPVAIDVISTLSYGNVVLDGIVQKSTPVGKPGEYTLFASSGNYIVLVATNLDPYISRYVHVTGVLSPPAVEGGKATLIVNTLVTK